jgi:DNA-binding SARP family transcriptional activator
LGRVVVTALESALRELAATVAAGAPRVLAVSAPPGYGKSAFLREYANHAGRLVTCDLTASGAAPDLARPIFDTLVAGDSSRAARFAADRLAQRPDAAAAISREALRREWASAAEPQLFVLRDLSGALETPAGAELFDELVSALPLARTLAVSTRTELPPALDHIASRQRRATVRAADLAMGRDAVGELARVAGLSGELASRVDAIAGGWALVVQLLIGLSARDAGETLDAAASLSREALLPFAAHRTIARLPEPVREALAVTALQHRGATHRELIRVLGDVCDDAIFARLAALPFVEVVTERGTGGAAPRALVHPEIAALLRARFDPLMKALSERTLNALAGDGAYAAAARIALDGGDTLRAAAILDAAPPYTAAPAMMGDYQRVVERIDRELITRFPNLWIATIPHRSFSVDPATFVREAETVFFCLPAAATADQRAASLMLLASAYSSAGRIAECDRLVEDALHGFASGDASARVSILNFAASLRGIEGRFTLARALAHEAGAISRDTFGEAQTLHYIDAHEAAYRGWPDRLVVILDELVRRRMREELPLYLAYVVSDGAFFAWANGQDETFGRYLDILEDVITPGLERGMAPILDAARGRNLPFDAAQHWPAVTALAHLYRLASASTHEASLAAARAAAHAADARCDPYLRILAHIALYVLDEPSRVAEAAILEAVLATFESPEMHDAVRGVVAGTSGGILEPFVRQRVLHDRAGAEPRLVVELLAAHVTRDGAPVHLTDREFELLAFLASTHGPVSRDRIGEALWDHLDPSEWPNNLKVTLSRIRTKLGVRDVVQAAEGRYRLSPLIQVDLRRAEALVRECVDAPLEDALREQLLHLVSVSRSSTTGRYDRYAWMQPLVARIDDLVCTVGVVLANDALARAQYDEALRHASAVRAVDPFNEGACEATIRVLLQRGQLDAARREFRRYAAALAHELNAKPSPRLAQLVSGPP